MLGDRPLVAYDVETTGLDRARDHIIQIAMVKYDWNAKKIIESKNFYVRPEGNYSIPLGSYLVHGISCDFLKDKPHFKDIAQEVIDFFDGCDILTYNGCSFDNAMLVSEFARVGIDFNPLKYDNYDAFYEEKRRRGTRLVDVFRYYYGKTMEECGLSAHDAFSDVKATISVFVKQQEEKEYDPEELLTIDNVISMQEFRGELKPCFGLGKYRGVPVEMVAALDQGYIAWAIGDKSSFVKSTKDYLRKYLK